MAGIGDGGYTVMAGTPIIYAPGGNANADIILNDLQTIINWENFNTIDSQVVKFFQTIGGNPAVLNRITGGGVTQFNGDLLALSIDVFIINTRGIMFGPTSYDITRNFVVSGIDIKNDDVINGVYQFQENFENPYGYMIGDVETQAGSEIVAENMTALIGKNVYNRGTIITTAPDGAVVMAAGKSVYLSEIGSTVAVQVDDIVFPEDYVVNNEGTITTYGKVILAGGDIWSTDIEGIESLRAQAKGNITLNGAIIANSNITLSAYGNVDTQELTAGGNIDISGNFIRLNMDVSTNGGDLTIDGPVDVEGNLIASGLIYLKGTINNIAGDVLSTGSDIIFDHDVIADRVGSQVFDAGLGALNADGSITKIMAGSLNLGGDGGIELADDVTTTDGDLTFEDAVTADGFGSQVFYTEGGTLSADGTITKATEGDLRLDSDETVDLNGTVEVMDGSFISIGFDFDNTGAAIITTGGDITINHTGIVTLGADLDPGGGILSGTATTVIVTPNGKIQDAIDIAVDGAEIIVQPGIYTGEGNRDIDFKGKAITIRSTDPNDPNVVAATIVDCNGTAQEPHIGFLFNSAESADSVLAGFKVTGGYNPIGGGGIDCNSSSPTITNCTITGNIATCGGGIACTSNSSPTIATCKITDNTAIVQGGGIGCYFYSSPIVTNCLITKNTATYDSGGGIFSNSSSPSIKNCTLSGNLADYAGGGIYCFNSISTISNSILWGNSAMHGPQIGLLYPSTLMVSYSDIQGGVDGVYVDADCTLNWGNGNIDADPCFVYMDFITVTHREYNPITGTWRQWTTEELYVDAHLLPSSPCIDAGDPCYVTEPNVTDLDGNPRVIGGRIDMGAYEFQNQFFVDNDALNDPAPNNPSISDPCEDGSWEHPFDAIQEAINAAYNGYIVKVLTGIYTGTGNRDIDFLGKAIIVRSENGPENCIIDCNGETNNPHSGFYFHSGEDSNSILDSFTITNGLVLDFTSGGGIYCDGSNPTISNCILTGNSADGYGGGMFCNESSPMINNCIFSNNSSRRGAGGGFSGKGYSISTLVNCVFSGNSASGGGGVFYYNGTLTLIGCKFSGNSAGDRGGGVFCYGATVTLTNCILTGNWTNIFEDHGGGGGVYCWGMEGDSSILLIDGCLIAGNYSASHGGGVLSETDDSVITNCTFAGNFSEENGGAILSNSDTLEIDNNIFWENSAGLLGNSIYIGGGYYHGPCVLNISYSDIQGGQNSIHGTPGSTLIWGAGNIDVEPLFVNPGYWDPWYWIGGDYHLLPESQCIDAGDPNYPADDNDVDLDGNPRVIGSRIDMGAYEYSPERFPDLNGDGIVNFEDYAILVYYWINDICEEPEWCEGSDLDESGAVDFYDLAIFVEYWLEEFPVQFFSNSLDTDPKWATAGEWVYGQPVGEGGIEYGNPDPTIAYTGMNVYGVNLNGDYSTAVGGPYYVTTGPLDCSGYRDVSLKFARWLNTDDPEYVYSTVEVSNDGNNWSFVWEHNRRPAITNSSWRIVEYDISSIADDQETVYIRWGYEILEYAYPYSGWNIDDIQLWGNPR